ncbi:MAG: hypothetical protein ACREDR_26700, partial [Blastocatellia bacterium]
QWSRGHVRKLVFISCLMSRGIRRYAAIRAHFWLVSQDPLTKLIRPSLISEYRRFRKRTFRKITTDAGPALNEAQNEKRMITLARQLGLSGLDPLARDQVISMFDIMTRGIAQIPADSEPMTIATIPIPTNLNKLGAELVSKFPFPAWLKPTVESLKEMFRQMVVGLAGDPDELDADPDEIEAWAAEEIMRTAPHSAFIATRQLTQIVPWLFRNAGNFIAAANPAETTLAALFKSIFDRLSAEIETPRGYLLLYVQLLQWIVRQKGNGIVFARDSYEVVPLLQRIINSVKIDDQIIARLKSGNPISVIVLLIKPDREMTPAEIDLRNWLRRRLRNYGVADLDRWRRSRKQRC